MATHSSILAWRIAGTQEPGRLHSMGLRVGRDLVTMLSTLTGMTKHSRAQVLDGRFFLVICLNYSDFSETEGYM